MKKIFTVIIISSASMLAMAQDSIYKYNGDVISAKVTEITPTEVRYKRFEMLDGPIFVEMKSNVSKIKYMGGILEVFKKEQAQQQVVQSTYSAPKPMSNEIEVRRNRYVYKDEMYNERDIQEVMLKSKDNKIVYSVMKSQQAKKMRYIGFVGIPFGAVAIGSGYLALLIWASGDPSYSSFLEVSGACLAAGTACLVIGLSNNEARKKHQIEAIRQFNDKYK